VTKTGRHIALSYRAALLPQRPAARAVGPL